MPLALSLLLLALPQLALAFNVCVLANNLGGYPLCAPGVETSYNGYDVETFKAAAGLAGWTYSNTAAGRALPPINRTWAWTCILNTNAPTAVPWMLNASYFDECAILMGGVAVTTSRIASGVNYGLSIRNETAQLLIYDNATSSVDIWSFIRPFTASLWIAFVLTLLAIPMSIWIVEQLSTNGQIVFNYITIEDLAQSLYRNILAIFNQDVMYVGSFGGQLIMIAFLFMIMIVISTYTANLAAFNTVTPPGPSANSLLDFAGKKILVDPAYAALVAGMYPSLNFTIANTTESAANRLLSVKNGVYDVFFETLPTLYPTIMALNDCNFKIIGAGVDATDASQVFHVNFPASVKAEYDTAVIKIATIGEFDPINGQLAQPTCTTPSNTPVVTFQQVLGLWIILSSVSGFGCCCAVATTVFRYVARHRRLTAVGPDKGSLSVSFKGSMKGSMKASSAPDGTPMPSTSGKASLKMGRVSLAEVV